MDVRLLCFGSGIFDLPDTSGDMFYDLIDPLNIDILILISGCFGSDLSTDVVKRFMEKFSNIPAISIGIEIPGIPSIVTDNITGMKNVIDHVITVHNCTRIAFIKGPENNDEANIRFDEYKKCLMNYSIPFDPGLVCEGNFEEEAGYNAVKTL